MFISDVELPTLFIRSINLTEGIVVKSFDTEQKNNHLFKSSESVSLESVTIIDLTISSYTSSRWFYRTYLPDGFEWNPELLS